MLRTLICFALADDGSVKARVARSGLWAGVSNVAGTILNVGRSIVLARLLTPEVFGLMGLAGVVLRAVETVTRPGIVQALIARQGGFEGAAATAFTLLVFRGLCLGVLLAAAAPWIAGFYESALLTPVLFALSAVFVLNGLVNINLVARQKELAYRHLSYLGLATTTIGTGVTIALAFWLRSVWALVLGQVATAGLNAFLSYVFIGGWPRFHWNREIARELFRYGKFITGSSIALFVARAIDSAVIGKLLGIGPLGFYALALTIANLGTANLSNIASGIMMSAYSELQFDRRALQWAYLRALSLVMLVVTPVTAGLMLVAEPLIAVVYGDQWLPAVAPLRILALGGLIRALAAFNGQLFEGIGLPNTVFLLRVLQLVVVAPLIVPMTLTFGLQGAAATMTLGVSVQWLAGLVYLDRHLGIGLASTAAFCWRPLWTTGAMAVVAFAVRQAIGGNSLASLSVVVASGIIVYGALNVRRVREFGRERMGGRSLAEPNAIDS